MAKTKLKTYSLNELKEEFIGPRGTKIRDKHEHKLTVAVNNYLAKKNRPKNNVTKGLPDMTT